jgi:hypothetical protein
LAPLRGGRLRGAAALHHASSQQDCPSLHDKLHFAIFSEEKLPNMRFERFDIATKATGVYMLMPLRCCATVCSFVLTICCASMYCPDQTVKHEKKK